MFKNIDSFCQIKLQEHYIHLNYYQQHFKVSIIIFPFSQLSEFDKRSSNCFILYFFIISDIQHLSLVYQLLIFLVTQLSGFFNHLFTKFSFLLTDL